MRHAADESVSEAIELFVLETAKNTYVAMNGSHRAFDSDTDLMYPPLCPRPFSA